MCGELIVAIHNVIFHKWAGMVCTTCVYKISVLREISVWGIKLALIPFITRIHSRSFKFFMSALSL